MTQEFTLRLIEMEAARVGREFPAFPSMREGFAVILEEEDKVKAITAMR